MERLDIGARLETFARGAKAALPRQELLAAGPMLLAKAATRVASEAPPIRHPDDQ